MPTHHPEILLLPQPTKIFFDPFNSSSTGHQTAPSRLSGSTSWRESRGYKLSHQLRDSSGRGGAHHLNDLVGAGSENYQKDGRKDNGDWEKGAPGLREKGWQDIRTLMQGTRKRLRSDPSKIDCNPRTKIEHPDLGACIPGKKRKVTDHDRSNIYSRDEHDEESAPTDIKQDHGYEKDTRSARLQLQPPPQIFRGLTIYLNGSTAPLISDHRLKHLFVSHGGNASIALGRRTVTHVIIGKTGGGGLTATKIQKENTTVGGKSIKFVTAQWVLDSTQKGVRQPEGRYQPALISGRIGGSGQKSVAGIFTTS